MIDVGGDLFKKFPGNEIERDVRTTLIDVHLNQIEGLRRRSEPRARIGNMDGEIALANRQTEISGGDIRNLGIDFHGIHVKLRGYGKSRSDGIRRPNWQLSAERK